MPIPKPNTDETKEKFIERCMGELNSEYPDEKQRYANCNTAWEKKDTEKESNSALPSLETRSFSFELRTSEDNPSLLKGHAAVFEKLSDPLPVLGGKREKIRKGAFSQTIIEDDIRALWNHDPNYILGRNKAGTLRLFEDEQGLAMEIDTPDTQFARDLMVSIRRGDITQMSFSFGTIEDSWDERRSVRTLHRVKLFDVSPVTFPAYPQTDVKVRSILSKKGIDFDKLMFAMDKKDSGQELNQEERELLDKTAEALKVPPTTGAVEDVAVKLEPNRNDNLRRRINIASA